MNSKLLIKLEQFCTGSCIR